MGCAQWDTVCLHEVLASRPGKPCSSENQGVRGLFECHMEESLIYVAIHPLSILPYWSHVNLSHELSLILFASRPSHWLFFLVERLFLHISTWLTPALLSFLKCHFPQRPFSDHSCNLFHLPCHCLFFLCFCFSFSA